MVFLWPASERHADPTIDRLLRRLRCVITREADLLSSAYDGAVTSTSVCVMLIFRRLDLLQQLAAATDRAGPGPYRRPQGQRFAWGFLRALAAISAAFCSEGPT